MTGHNIVPFGRTEDEKTANLRRALHDAELAASANRHPSAPQWASQRRRSEAERAAAIRAAKPECTKCGVMFNPRGYIPKDLLCMACRKKAAVAPAESGPKLATLFDQPQELDE